MPLDHAELIRRLSELEIDRVVQFIHGITEQYESDLTWVDNQAGDSEWAELQADEAGLLNEVLNLGQQLAVVALYRVVELNTAKALKMHWSAAGYKTLKLYRIDKAKAALKTIGIDLTNLPNFATIDELRCANNAVKHEGKVTKDLAAFKGWKEGEPLNGLDKLANDAANVIPMYLEGLVKAVRAVPKPPRKSVSRK